LPLKWRDSPWINLNRKTHYSFDEFASKRSTVYIVYMSTTITIRTGQSLREALEERAKARGITLSQAAREILQDALEKGPKGPKTEHLRGRLKIYKSSGEPWRKSLREHNWRS